MPKSGKKSEKKIFLEIASDVTLSDFANCNVAAGRLRKSVSNSSNKKIKDIYESEKLWDEKEIEEFEFPETSTQNQKKKILPSKPCLKDQTYAFGIRYPIDLWFLISKYIKPEDVCIFTLLCKDSYFVSRTYTFWINMYKRHYNSRVTLPNRLQPDNIERPLYLKACVIRSLYHTYSLFTNRLKIQHPDATHNLTNLFCTSVWHVQNDKKWFFHFKFHSPIMNGLSKESLLKGSPVKILKNCSREIIKNHDDFINDNPDDSCKVLQIVSSNFVAIPQLIMGSRLTDVKINLAHDMRRQKIRLTFCFSTYKQFHKNVTGNKGFGGYGEIIEFDPVESITVLNWWHPQFPVSY